MKLLADEPDMLAAVTPADDGEGEGDAEVTELVPDDTAVDDTPVPEGLFPMNPSEGPLLDVP